MEEKYSRSRALKCGKRVYRGVDRISQLPDEILVVILSFLSLGEAVRTSGLSSRWSDLWKHIPNLDFDSCILKSHRYVFDLDEDVRKAKRYKYIETVSSVIQSHKALSLKKFRISLKVKKSDKCAVTKWLKFVLSRQVESLELDFKPCTKDSDIVVLEESLREESVISRATETLKIFQSLKILCLRCLKVSGEDIELFTRNCALLEQLTMQLLTLTSDVQLCGADLMLKHLEISRCHGWKSIKVSAPNLTRIRFACLTVTLSFANVPKLVEANFQVTGSLYNIDHLTPASAPSCYISQLQSLELKLFNPKVFWMSGFPNMPNMKKLAIRTYEVYTHSLLPVTSLIWASPRLEEIKIEFIGGLRDTSAWMGAITNIETSPHHHLKVFAFHMASRQFWDAGDYIVELVTCILDNCVALQEIIIGSTLDKIPADRITAEMQADADNLTRQLQAKVPNHIQLQLEDSLL